VSLFWGEMERRLRRAQIEALYEQYSRGLRAYACSVTGSFAAAEDAVHLVFERLLHSGIEISGPPTPYLYRAVHNAALNHIRSKTREAELTDIWLQSPLGMEQSGLELQSALAELPQEQREVIVLHIWAEMSFEEISIALEISPNTAASRYRYGLSKLRTQFASEPSQRKP
jgi:RNA polymerase sigma-70 factor (ECF subfamily)